MIPHKTEHLTPRLQLTLVLLIGLITAPHLWHLSPRITGLFYLMLFFRLLMIALPRLLPGKWILFFLLLVSLANVFIDTGLVGPKYATVALLTSMLGLKLLESRTPRDVYVLSFLGFFVMITQFLFEQGMGFSLYFFLLSLGLIAVLLDLNGGGSIRQVSLNALRLFLAAIPAMIVLFVLFPRLASPLWSFDIEDSTATTGITDKIRPGQVSQLSQSSATAFRVRFQSDPPPMVQRYWRGPVLWNTDGATWTAADQLSDPAFVRPDHEASGPLYRYELTMEATNQQWVFPLELPQAPIRNGLLTPDYQMRANAPIKSRKSYQLESHADFKLPHLMDWERRLGLKLPSNITQRMRQLVAGWRSKATNDMDLVQLGLNHFTNNPFVYTLSPPLLGDNPTDEFLFETQQGFCGHYATSFASLMRIAGIPARVVAGYQGGEMNPLGGHLIVRQSDAHAWVEVWISNQGWIRIDPTAAVAPDRIERSVSTDTGTEGTPVVFKLKQLGGLGNLFREAGWMLDNLDLQWHRWVVGFSQQSQRWLLDELGLSFLQGYWLGIAAIVGSLIALTIGLLLIRMKGHRDRDTVRKQYTHFCQRLRMAGLDVPRYLGPLDLEKRAVLAFPRWRNDIQQITDLYIGLRYGANTSQKTQRRFRHRVWLFLLLRWKLLPGFSRNTG